MINAQEFFTHTLHDSEAVTALLAYTEDADGFRLPNIFEYPCEEELGDNPGKPYIVVRNTVTQQDEHTKDDGFASYDDITTIDVVCVTNTKDEAKEVALVARNAIAVAMDEYEGHDTFGWWLDNAMYGDRGVQYDVESGSYVVTMTYRLKLSLY